MSVNQIDWTEFRRGISHSKGLLWKCFTIARTTGGYTAADNGTKELTRVVTLAAARPWCGIHVGERAVRHGR